MQAGDDRTLYLIVAKELSIGRRDEGLWTKAFAMEGGDEKATKAHYIRERVEHLKWVKNNGNKSSNTTSSEVTSDSVVYPKQSGPDASGASSDVFPWSRFFSRGIDLGIVTVLALSAEFLLATSLPTRGMGAVASALLSVMIFGFAMLGYEIGSLSLFGTTIGKALFGIRISADGGGHVGARSAFLRSFWVWSSGNLCYFFFPMLTLFAWWDGYKRLTTSGTTSWDTKANVSVSQSKISSIRFSIGALIGIVLLITVVVLNAMSALVTRNELTAERQANNNAAHEILDSQTSKTPPKALQSTIEKPFREPSFPSPSEIPSQAGISFAVAGLRSDGVLLATISNASNNWQASTVEITLVDADQHMDVINGKRTLQAYFEKYDANIDVAPRSSQSIEVPVRWNYQRDFLAFSNFKGFVIGAGQ